MADRPLPTQGQRPEPRPRQAPVAAEGTPKEVGGVGGAQAPVPQAPRPQRSPRPPPYPVPGQLRLIGWLLVAVTLLGLLTVLALVTTQASEESYEQLRHQSGSGRIKGRVVDPAGEPLYQVNLTLEGTSYYTLTDGNGEFELTTVPAGKVNLSLTKIGYTTLYYLTYQIPDQDRGLKLTLEPGTGSRTIDDDGHRDQLAQARNLCVVVLLGLLVLTGLGAQRAFQGRDFAWVAGGAIMGLFTFGFGLGILLALAALYLSLKHKGLFREWETELLPLGEST